MKEPLVKIAESDRKLAEASFNRHFITVPPGTPQDALLNPLSYAHIARYLGEMDELIVVPNDASFYARLLVLFADRQQAKVVVLDWHDLTHKSVEAEDIASNYEVRHIPNREVRWCVVRKADKARLVQGLASKEEAYAWIAKNQQRMAA